MPVHTRRYYFISCPPACNQTNNQALEHHIQQASENLNTIVIGHAKIVTPAAGKTVRDGDACRLDVE